MVHLQNTKIQKVLFHTHGIKSSTKVLVRSLLSITQTNISLPLSNPNKCSIWNMKVTPLVKFGNRDSSEYKQNIQSREYYHLQQLSSNQKTNPNQQQLKSTNVHGKSKGEGGQYLRGRGLSVSPHSPHPTPQNAGFGGIWGAGGEQQGGAGFGRLRERVEGRGRRGPARAQVNGLVAPASLAHQALVVPLHVARQARHAGPAR